MKTRFAPSPTGFLHLGNIRTALFNALFAYHEKGDFLLRIEDTDQERSTTAFTESIMQDMQWLGLDWVSTGEASGVALQSQRSSLYQQYYDQLINNGDAYPCFCTEERLQALRETQRLNRQPPGYDGHCRSLSSEEIANKQHQGMHYHLRFRVPSDQKIVFEDIVKGEQCFHSDHLYDFVIQRSDKRPTFLYCNALDDATMDISHVLRGEDHLSNTAKQLLILRALDLPAPRYGHLPLISLQDSTAPLSKREGSFNVRGLREKGYLAIALNNYLARLGHTITQDVLMSISELAESFRLEALHHSSAHFDLAQLNFWQKKAVQQQSAADFWTSLGQTVHQFVPVQAQSLFIQVMQAMITLPEEAEKWAELLFCGTLNYTVDAKEAIQGVDMAIWPELVHVMQSHQEDPISLNQALKANINRFEPAVRKHYWRAIRAALTNTFKGPELIAIIQLLGIHRACERLVYVSTLK